VFGRYATLVLGDSDLESALSIIHSFPELSSSRTVIVVIFDFDGTIADTFDAVLQISHRLALEFGFPPPTSEDVKRFQNLRAQEIVRQSKIPIVRLPFILRRLKAELSREVPKLKLIPGMQDALITLKQHGHQLGIVTSNSEENVLQFLQVHGLTTLFDFVYSSTTLFGKGRVIHRILKQRHIDSRKAIYVGDETRDVEAAKKTNITVVAVSWGFNSGQILARQQPDFLIHQPHELVTLVEKLQCHLKS